MSLTVSVLANTLSYPRGGGHLWVYLNWALGLRALGCRVIWLEGILPRTPVPEVKANVAALKRSLERYGLADCVAVCSWTGEPLPRGAAEGCLDLDAAGVADLLLNLAYDIPPQLVGRFRRSAFVDIDPGQSQIWMHTGLMRVARHDVYFTIGETVGRLGALFPDCGLRWHYTPPPVFLPAWPPIRSKSTAPYTTVTHWWGSMMEFQGQSYYNGKRDGFLPFLDLPRCSPKPLELAVCLAANETDTQERVMLRKRGWRVRDAHAVACTPWGYQRYIQQSRGEFSCAKPSCARLQNAWISDRTLCYLASGKPAVVQHTGPSRFLPDAEGLFRFRDIEEASRHLSIVEKDYERHSRAALAIAEEYFNSEKVLPRLLGEALG